MEKEIKNHIPYGNADRVGNFKVWRGDYAIHTDNGKSEIPCVYVSTLDGTWQTRIPATWEMYGHLMLAYNDFKSDDKEHSEHGELVLRTIFSNMLYVSSVGNGYYQQALNFVATVYANPSLLTDKKQYKAVKDDTKRLIGEFLEWRKMYDESARRNEPTPEEEHQEELAEQSAEIVNVETPIPN